MSNCVIHHEPAKIKELTRSDRLVTHVLYHVTYVILDNYANEIIGHFRNIKETFLPKNGMWKKQLLARPSVC